MGDLLKGPERSNFPTGTVTFLFTDIEGSTKLAQQHPEAMPSLLARHHEILHQCIEANNGHVFQIVGDAFCASFYTVRDGLMAAVDAQCRLQGENWGNTPIRVRMGLHTGSAGWDGKDYRGYLTLAKVQRIMSLAWGGQVLLSNSSAELLHGELPEGITVRDLKEHRLKGLPDPEHLWQMVAQKVQQDFPPLQSLKEVPNNLPVQLTRFIGREKEVEQIKKRLENNRLVTLTGSGGIGKTRLSIRVASELLDEYPNGAWLVELAPIADPEWVARAFCAVLDIAIQGNASPLTVLTEYLHSKKLLLVVDNCEHLIDTCAQLCDSLLLACPDLRILASSREALGIDGENSYRVPSLSLPDPKSGWAAIEGSEAVKLFVGRANAVLPEFELTESNAFAITQICKRLDGIALAIELAASRVKLLRVEQIASRLDDAFRLLTGGSRTALPRQQTLRALIDWSYNLLSEQERTLLRRLSVFMGGWTLEAAEFVGEDADMLDLLTHLVDKSLVVVDLEHGNEPRYYLLETIRQYGREKLSGSGEADSIRDRHLAYYLAFAVRAEPEVQGAEQLVWFDRLDAEIDNFRTALEWSLNGDEKRTERGLQMASSLWWFWYQRSYRDESQWLKKTLEASQNSTDLVRRANALVRLAWVRFFDEMPANEGLAIGQTLGSEGRESVALALLGKGAWAVYQADYAQAISLVEESLQLFRKIGNRWGICEALTWMGLSLIFQGDHQKAIAPLQESLALAQQTQDGNEIGFALWQLGRAAMARGDYSQATTFMKESLALYRELKLFGGVTFLLGDLGRASLGQGNYQQAAFHYREALTIYWDLGSKRYIAQGLEQLADVAMMCQQYTRAARLLGAAEAIRQSIGAALFPFQREDYQRSLDVLRSQLDETALATHWAEGQTMNTKQAVEYALE